MLENPELALLPVPPEIYQYKREPFLI